MAITLACWNVAGRVRRQPEQAARIASLGADVVCLQEVSPTTVSAWLQALGAAGLEHVALADREPADQAGRTRPLMALTAARMPLAVEPVADLPWPERVVAARLAAAQPPAPDGLLVVNVHSPISSRPGLVKVLTHEAVHRYLTGASGPRLVCGDLNTPRREHPDGRVWTFARTSHGRLRPERGERWDQAELALIRGLEPHGFRDAFRALHGPEVRELSWEWPRWGGGYRLDHLIVSAEVAAESVEYRHEWRREGLSDHSALVARIGPAVVR